MKCNALILLATLFFLCPPPLLAVEPTEGDQEVTLETETGVPTETSNKKKNGKEKEKTESESEEEPEPDCE